MSTTAPVPHPFARPHAYPQHPPLALPAFEDMTLADQVAHLLDDHGHATTAWQDGPTDVAGWSPESRSALHDEDHTAEDGVMRHLANDEDTGTWNDHRHYRSARSFAAAVVAAAGTHDTYAQDPGGFLSYVVSTEDDPEDWQDLERVANAAAALLAHDATWLGQ